MNISPLLGLIILVGISQAEQLPLSTANDTQLPRWDDPPNPDVTGHLIYDTAVSLFKHWPNTYHRNGHTVVPVTVSPGTLLYHGRNGNHSPKTPPEGAEWLSFDLEHALYFASFQGELYTYTPSRPIRLLYFDGSSAAPIPTGTLDSQDVLVYGNVSREWHWDPFVRIGQLCEWAKANELDGFLRMGFDFEIMHCNFSSSLTLISSIDVLPVAPPASAGWAGSLRSPHALAAEALAAGNWHNVVPLPGVRIDYSKLLSFYDPRYRSLFHLRRGQDRAMHRLLNISSQDVELFMHDLTDVLRRPAVAAGVGKVNWEGLMRNLRERYADRLPYLQHLLHAADATPPTTETPEEDRHQSLSALVADVRQQILTMLAPYISPSSVTLYPSGHLPNSWFSTTHARCAAAHTQHLHAEELTAQERLLQQSIAQTHAEICRVLLLLFQTAYTAESFPIAHQFQLLTTWSSKVDELLEWLDWGEWQICRPMCGVDEVCALKQWPFEVGRNGTDRSGPPRCESRLKWNPRNELQGQELFVPRWT